MRNLAITFAVAALSLGAAAQVSSPRFFYENFREMGERGDYLDDDWVTYGNGAMPTETMVENFFLAGEKPPYYVILDYQDLSIPVSCTNFTPSTPADQWLVTPQIEIPSDNCELEFMACLYTKAQWGQGKNPYKILVSESGVGKGDFAEVPVFESTVNFSRTSEVVTKQMVCPLNGYGGKKIHLAFVSTGENLGLTGFTNIGIGNYAVTVDNRTPRIVELGAEVTPSVNIGMKTPVACPGLTARLEVPGREPQEVYYKKPFGNAGNSLIYQLVKFDSFVIDIAESVNYTITVTPDYEGAPSTVVSGSIGVPKFSYPANVVIEEVTASGCQACPAGTASIEYYLDTWTPAENHGKPIPIAVHGYVDYEDPMMEGVNDYLIQLQTFNASTSYPSACFNRATKALVPWRRAEYETLLNGGSYSMLEITAVETDAVDGRDPWSVPLKVSYRAKNSYSAENLNFRVAAVMIENDVKGSSRGYDQTNGFYNRDTQYIANSYGEFLVPYMTEYLAGGSKGKKTIPFSEMTYQHVARGIFPSFYGQEFNGGAQPGPWTEDEWKEGEISFEIPETILNLSNTEVVVLLLDGESNAIVGSDIFPAKDFIAPGAGVEETFAEAEGDVEVYSLDGRKVAAGDATGALPSGLYIVKKGNSVRKVII